MARLHTRPSDFSFAAGAGRKSFALRSGVETSEHTNPGEGPKLQAELGQQTRGAPTTPQAFGFATK
jgi:hypothetical protein